MKTVIIGVALAVVMFIAGCTGSPATHGSSSTSVAPSIAVAQADAIDAAIALFADIPGMTSYLNEMRSIGWIETPGTVSDAAQFGLMYCGLPPELQAIYNDGFATATPDVAPQWKSAQDDLCAALD